MSASLCCAEAICWRADWIEVYALWRSAAVGPAASTWSLASATARFAAATATVADASVVSAVASTAPLVTVAPTATVTVLTSHDDPPPEDDEPVPEELVEELLEWMIGVTPNDRS